MVEKRKCKCNADGNNVDWDYISENAAAAADDSGYGGDEKGVGCVNGVDDGKKFIFTLNLHSLQLCLSSSSKTEF